MHGGKKHRTDPLQHYPEAQKPGQKPVDVIFLPRVQGPAEDSCMPWAKSMFAPTGSPSPRLGRASSKSWPGRPPEPLAKGSALGGCGAALPTDAIAGGRPCQQPSHPPGALRTTRVEQAARALRDPLAREALIHRAIERSRRKRPRHPPAA